jgi:PAS domain-containing protein
VPNYNGGNERRRPCVSIVKFVKFVTSGPDYNPQMSSDRRAVGNLAKRRDERNTNHLVPEYGESFRCIVNGIPAFVCTLTDAGQIEFVNDQVLEYFGHMLDELKNARHVHLEGELLTLSLTSASYGGRRIATRLMWKRARLNGTMETAHN